MLRKQVSCLAALFSDCLFFGKLNQNVLTLVFFISVPTGQGGKKGNSLTLSDRVSVYLELAAAHSQLNHEVSKADHSEGFTQFHLKYSNSKF